MQCKTCTSRAGLKVLDGACLYCFDSTPPPPRLDDVLDVPMPTLYRAEEELPLKLRLLPQGISCDYVLGAMCGTCKETPLVGLTCACGASLDELKGLQQRQLADYPTVTPFTTQGTNIFAAFSLALHRTPAFAGYYERLVDAKFLGDAAASSSAVMVSESSVDLKPESNAKSKISIGKLLRFLSTAQRKSIGDIRIIAMDDDACYSLEGSKFDVDRGGCTIALRTVDRGVTWWPLQRRVGPSNDQITPTKENEANDGSQRQPSASPVPPLRLKELRPQPESQQHQSEQSHQQPLPHQPSSPLKRKESTLPRGHSWWATDTVPTHRTATSPRDVKKAHKIPFQGLMYPSIEPGQTHFLAISKAGVHPIFTRNRAHVVGSCFFMFVALVLTCAALGVVDTNFGLCCALANQTDAGGQCLGMSGYSSENASTFGVDSLVGSTCLSACVELKDSEWTYLYSGARAPGALGIIALILCFASVVGGLLSNFFMVRSLAEQSRTVRCWKVMWAAHVLLIVASIALHILFLFGALSDEDREAPCTRLLTTGQPVCRTLTPLCQLSLRSKISNVPKTILPLVVSAMVSAFLALLAAIIPPMPAEETLESLPKAVADTRTFRKSEYAPDGIDGQELARLQERIQFEFAKKHASLVDEESLMHSQDDHNKFSSIKRRRQTFVGSHEAGDSDEDDHANQGRVAYAIEMKAINAHALGGSVQKTVADVAHRVITEKNMGKEPPPSRQLVTYQGDPTLQEKMSDDDDTVADILGLPRNILQNDRKETEGESTVENAEAKKPLLDEEIDIRGTAFMDDFDLAEEFDFDAAKERTNSHLVQHYLSTQHRLYCIFEGRPLTQKDRYISITINALLLITVFVTCILFCIESYPYYYKRQGIDYSSATGIFYVETICIAIFIAELLVRLFCVPFKELLNVFFFIDVISVLVYFSDLIIDLATQYSSFQGLSIVRALRLVRVMRVFKLSRYSATLQLVLVVLKNSAGGLTILLVPFILVIMVLSVALYFFEQLNQHWDEGRRRWIDDDTGGPSNFQSIPDSIWFSVATVTTTGYGDIVPRTIPGKIVAVVLQYIGVLILSFPNIILGTNLQLAFRKYHKNQARRFLGRKFRVVFHLLCFVRLAKDKLAETRRLKAEAEQEAISERNSNSDTASTATSEPTLVDLVDLDLHINSKSKKAKRKTNFFATKQDFDSIRSSVEGMGLIRDDTIRFWAFNGVSAVTLLQRLLEGFSGVATAEDLFYCFQLDGGPNEHLTLKDICLTLYFLFEGGFVQLFVFKQYTTKLLVCLTQTAVSEMLLYPEEGVVECVRGADFARMLWRQTTGQNAQFSLHSLFSSYSRWSSKEKYVDNTSDSLDLKPQHSSPAVVVQGALPTNTKGRSPQQRNLLVPSDVPVMNGSFTGPPAFMLGNTLNSLGGLEKHGSGFLSTSGYGDYPNNGSPFHSGNGAVGGVTIEEAKLQLKLLLTLQRAEVERVKQELQHHTSGRGH